MSDANPYEKLSAKVSQSASSAAENLGNRLTGSSGSNGRGEQQYLLPDDIKALLDAPMKDLGFPLESNVGRIRDWAENWHNFYQSRIKGGYLAFLYVGNKILESSVHSTDFAWIGILFSQNGAKGLFIFSDSSSIQPAYETLAEYWQNHQGFLRARFFNYSYINTLMKGDLESRKADLKEWFKYSLYLPLSQFPSASLTFEDLINDQGKKEKIVTIIANTAANAAGLTPQMYINDLIQRTNWSMAWRTQVTAIWDGNAEATARKLVSWALSRKISTTNPSYTTIAGLLEPLIRTDLDREAGLYLFQLIQEHALISDSNIIQKIYADCFSS